MPAEKPAKRTYSPAFEKVIAEVRPRSRKPKAIGRTSRTPLGHFLVLFALFGVILAGGGKYVWTQGLFVAVVGLCLLFRPPHRTLSPKLDWTVIILAGVCCLAFFPADWFRILPNYLLGRPGWWKSISGDGVALPITISPQPMKTLEGVALLGAGIGMLYLLINVKLRTDDRWRLLQAFAVVGGLLAVLVAWGSSQGFQYPLTDRAASFSFFDNRNQTSILMAMTGMVALSLTFFGLSVRWYWALISGLVYLAAAIAVSVSLSKGGLLLFVTGSGFWIITRFATGSQKGIVRIAVPVVALSFALMLITGQHTLSRFSAWMEEDGGPLQSFRVSIFQDTMTMIATQPVSGVGVGNFPAVFPLFRNQSINASPIIHPESDWLWLAAEMGAPGLSIMATLVFLLFWLMLPFGADRTAPIRGGALMAVVLLLLHSLFDVPGHRLGTVLIAIWLYRMAAPRQKLEFPCKFPPWLWRIGGAVFLLVGSMWVFADVTGAPLQSAVAKRELTREIEEALEDGDPKNVGKLIDRALWFSPLDWEIYLHRGQADLYLNGDSNAARENFLRARRLEPVLVEPAVYEGKVWLPRSTHYAYDAWLDAIARDTRDDGRIFQEIISAANGNPRFTRDLDRLSQTSSEFRTIYLRRLNKSRFLRALSEDLRRDPALENFTVQEREQILLLWLDRGDPGDLLRFVEKHPQAVPNTWYFKANAWARLGNHRRAIDIAREFAPVAPIPAMEAFDVRTTEEQRALFAGNPADIVRGGNLLKRQLAGQDVEGARWTLDRLAKADEPPLYVYYWSGELHRLDENYEAAWKDWKFYLLEVIERRIRLRSASETMFGEIDGVRKNPLLWDLVEPFER